MKQGQAEQIEKDHNVYVDASAEMYTTVSRDDAYGWLPVPEEWIEETR